MQVQVCRFLLLSMVSFCLILNACTRNQYVSQDTMSTGPIVQ